MNILFVGAIPPPYHGQAIAFNTAYQYMTGTKYLVNQNFETKPAVIKTLHLLISFFKIWYYLLFKKIDIVYFTCSRSVFGSIKDVFLVYSVKLFGLPVINHLHGAGMRDFIEKLPRFYRPIVFEMYKQIDISIVLLESMRHEFHQYWPAMDVRVIPNFYSSEFDTVQNEDRHAVTKIVYLSNIIYSKGILDLLDAFSSLSLEYDNIELIIAGDFMGDEFYSREEIQEMFSSRLKDLPNARFIGVVSGEAKVKLLAQTDIFVLPTFYSMEAFPLSIIEAMRSGNVVVTTKHNYLAEIIQPEMGFLVEPSSSTELALCLKNILSDPENMLSIQEYNRTYAKTHYTLGKYIEHLDSVVGDVLKQ